MLITLFRRTAIRQSISEVYFTGVVPLKAESHKFILPVISDDLGRLGITCSFRGSRFVGSYYAEVDGSFRT